MSKPIVFSNESLSACVACESIHEEEIRREREREGVENFEAQVQ